MAIQKQQFVDAGRWMMIPQERLPTDLRAADEDGSGAVDSPDEFGVLYEKIIAGGDSEAGLVSVAGLMQQANVAKPESLGGRRLKDVSELQAVWNGLGRIVRSRGVSAGTKAIQEALNEMSEKLPDYPKCYVGAADARFGPMTERGGKTFQALHQDLDVTGKIDLHTLKKMDEVLSRARSIKVNQVRPIDPGTLRMITYGDRFGRDCVLTFDDGPDMDTIKVLDALRAGKVQGATFFVQGINAKRYPQILRRIVDDGHVLGNHTYDHPDLRRLSIRQVEQQLRMCQDAVNDVLGREYVLKQMRPPYGALNDRVKSLLRAQDLAILLWQVDSNDWRPENRRNPRNIVHNVFGGRAPVTDGRGGLILFHDIHGTTGDIVPEIIHRLGAEGLNLTTAQVLFERKYAA